MTTRQFFQRVRDHLTPDGVAVINAGRTETDYRLVDVISSTMKAVFPNVYLIDLPNPQINSIVVSTNQPTQLGNSAANTADMGVPFEALLPFGIVILVSNGRRGAWSMSRMLTTPR